MSQPSRHKKSRVPGESPSLPTKSLIKVNQHPDSRGKVRLPVGLGWVVDRRGHWTVCRVSVRNNVIQSNEVSVGLLEGTSDGSASEYIVVSVPLLKGSGNGILYWVIPSMIGQWKRYKITTLRSLFPPLTCCCTEKPPIQF